MKKALLVILLLSGWFSIYASEDVNAFKKRTCQELSRIRGWCSPEKALEFIDLVLEVKPDVCVEIGVFYGSSLFPVASALQFLGTGVIIGIDPWDKLECIRHYDLDKDAVHIQWWLNVDMGVAYQSYLEMLKRNALENYCITIKKTADRAISQIEYIDILYLDGNHSEESTLQEVMLYLPKVSSNGFIWVNDALTFRSQKAIDILLESCDPVKVIENGNCVLFKKR